MYVNNSIYQNPWNFVGIYTISVQTTFLVNFSMLSFRRLVVYDNWMILSDQHTFLYCPGFQLC